LAVREPSAGFALNPVSLAVVPELTSTLAHLREALGDATYKSFVRRAEAINMATAAAYAYDQIDKARTELDRRR
jgi:hypothetical protein